MFWKEKSKKLNGGIEQVLSLSSCDEARPHTMRSCLFQFPQPAEVTKVCEHSFEGFQNHLLSCFDWGPVQERGASFTKPCSDCRPTCKLNVLAIKSGTICYVDVVALMNFSFEIQYLKQKMKLLGVTGILTDRWLS